MSGPERSTSRAPGAPVPSTQTGNPLNDTDIRAGSSVKGDIPTAASTRPQFGSDPNNAVLTRLSRATSRADFHSQAFAEADDRSSANALAANRSGAAAQADDWSSADASAFHGSNSVARADLFSSARSRADWGGGAVADALLFGRADSNAGGR